jgi:hypothetical protein
MRVRDQQDPNGMDPNKQGKHLSEIQGLKIIMNHTNFAFLEVSSASIFSGHRTNKAKRGKE